MSVTPRADGLHTSSVGESGSLIVFCHGLFGQGKNWSRIGKALAVDHRVLLVDMPQHGRSAWSDRFSYLGAADQVAELLSVDDPVTLVGHSMGGKVAMLVALRHPELVARLCVVDVAPVAYHHTSEFAGYVEAMLALDLGDLEGRSDADRRLAEAVPHPATRGFLLQNLRRSEDGWGWLPNLAVLGRDLAEVGGWPEGELAETAAYDGPVLWVAGGSSDYVKADHAVAMDRWFPRHRRVTIKDAGHWVHSEQPEIFIEVLRRFLA